MATKLKADGTSEEVKPATGTAFTLEELQRAVGGYVEVIRLPAGRYLLVDEDGKQNKKPENEQATKLAGPALRRGDFVVGDALVLTRSEMGN